MSISPNGGSAKSILTHPLVAVFATAVIALAGFVINDLVNRASDHLVLEDIKKQTDDQWEKLRSIDQSGTQSAKVTENRLADVLRRIEYIETSRIDPKVIETRQVDAIRRIEKLEQAYTQFPDPRLLDSRYQDALRRIGVLEKSYEKLNDRLHILESRARP